MSIFKEPPGITRRQFFKGSIVLLATITLGGVLSKIGLDAFAANDNYIKERAAGLYTLDEKMALRKSHENPEIIQLYNEFLSQPLSDKAHHLLHTEYGRNIPAYIHELENHSAA